jgi:hypothetical protein
MLQFRWASAIVLAVVLAGGVFLSPSAFAQDAAYVPLGPADLQQLTAPVALYPDAILAQVLVASTYPDDVVAAARWIDAGNNPAGIDDQDWDLSVKGIARYPDLLHYMAGNGDWMNELGDAFLNQQGDVMAAIQALRGEALASGSLASNDQQQVVVDGPTIEIIPTNPQIIYLPVYDPQVVYVMPEYPVGAVIVPRMRFGPGVRVGEWMHHDFDWDDRAIYVGSWGADRPWWRHEGGRPLDYTHDRPGVYRGGNITVNVHNRVTNVPAGQWTRQAHDANKPMPRPVARQGGRQPDGRPGAGFPPRAAPAPSNRGGAGEVAPPTYGQGSTVARQSARGQQSRQRAAAPPPARGAPVTNQPAAPARQSTPAPARQPAPAPARHALPPPTARPAAPAQPAPRAAPAPRPTPPAARPSAPVRGGAMGGYQSGPQAAASSSRGASSRGAASSAPQGRRGK